MEAELVPCPLRWPNISASPWSDVGWPGPNRSRPRRVQWRRTGCLLDSIGGYFRVRVSSVRRGHLTRHTTTYLQQAIWLLPTESSSEWVTLKVTGSRDGAIPGRVRNGNLSVRCWLNGKTKNDRLCRGDICHPHRTDTIDINNKIQIQLLLCISHGMRSGTGAAAR